VKYKIRAAAERDLDEAASWYGEHAADPRTPVRFLLEVRASFELIAESPGAFAEIHEVAEDAAEYNAFTSTPFIYAFGLLVSSETNGFPKRENIYGAF
jgi:plasmid stabilization system protein ParE